MVLDNDREVIAAALHSSKVPDPMKVKMIMIRDTLHLSDMYLSEGMLPDIEKDERLSIKSEPMEMRFDEVGNLLLEL